MKRSTKMIVYVALLNEGTPCWRPVQAEHVGGDRYLLCGNIPEDEEWQFQPGQVVRCANRKDSSGDEFLAAVELAV